MPQRKARETLYLNADRTELVPEGHADAAFLFVRKGSAINEAEAKRLGLEVEGDEAPVYDAKRDHFEKHGGMDPTAPAEQRARERMLSGQDDPDGPAAPGERAGLEEADATGEGDGSASGDAKSANAAPATKAVRASANKSR